MTWDRCPGGKANPVLRGWTTYFRHGASKRTFSYLNHYTWQRVVIWLRRKDRRANWKFLRRRYFGNRWHLADDGVALFDTRKVPVTRYRYRAGGSQRHGTLEDGHGYGYLTGLVESRMRWNLHVRFGERAGETDQPKRWHRAPARLHDGLGTERSTSNGGLCARSWSDGRGDCGATSVGPA